MKHSVNKPSADRPFSSLREYQNSGFSRRVPQPIEALWLLVQWLLVASWLPGSSHRRFLLRLFGASIGKGVVLKPGIRVKIPSRLMVGDHSWIGEDVWIDNLARVWIGANCCISQGAYICTGSHNWGRHGFDLITGEVGIGDGAWIAARSIVGPGVKIGQGAVLALGSVATANLEDWSVYRGNPAVFCRSRNINELASAAAN
ncbi:MAG: WcaF family extracellular polysaccharide biosynthesis acetyltransferase [Rhodomicrobium sp.]